MTLQPLPNLPFDPAAVASSIALWAKAATGVDSIRYTDILQMKRLSVEEFFQFCPKHPARVTQMDVSAWLDHLRTAPRDKRGKRLSSATVYHMAARLGAFYAWLVETGAVPYNPVDPVRPKAPKPFSSDKRYALSDENQAKLLAVIETEAKGGNVAAKRDYAYILWLFASGQRRNEIAQLSFDSFSIRGDTVRWTTRVKGGDVREQELQDWELVTAITDYIAASGRKMSKSPTPLWLSHDPARVDKTQIVRKENGQRVKHKRDLQAPVTTQALAKRAKYWAKQADIGEFHLHMTRHTATSQVYEESGSVKAAQEFTGHAKESTTQRYIHRVSVRKIKAPSALRKRQRD